MTDTHDKFTLFAHTVDEFHWMLASIISLAELAGSGIECTTETVTLDRKKCIAISFLVEQVFLANPKINLQ